MARIVICGTTGTGKTTLGRALAAHLGIDFTDLDDLRWLPGWVECANEAFMALAQDAVQKEGWVVAGNYSLLRDIIWTRADHVVWLDYSFTRTLWQLLRRSFRRAYSGVLICNGNRESFAKLFSRDSTIIWFFKSYWQRRKKMRAVLENAAAYPHITFLRMTTPAQTARWLQTF